MVQVLQWELQPIALSFDFFISCTNISQNFVICTFFFLFTAMIIIIAKPVLVTISNVSCNRTSFPPSKEVVMYVVVLKYRAQRWWVFDRACPSQHFLRLFSLSNLFWLLWYSTAKWMWLQTKLLFTLHIQQGMGWWWQVLHLHCSRFSSWRLPGMQSLHCQLSEGWLCKRVFVNRWSRVLPK